MVIIFDIEVCVNFWFLFYSFVCLKNQNEKQKEMSTGYRLLVPPLSLIEFCRKRFIQSIKALKVIFTSITCFKYNISFIFILNLNGKLILRNKYKISHIFNWTRINKLIFNCTTIICYQAFKTIRIKLFCIINWL
jgi:hypothetical protein